jgi:hypothetical protein
VHAVPEVTLPPATLQPLSEVYAEPGGGAGRASIARVGGGAGTARGDDRQEAH